MPSSTETALEHQPYKRLPSTGNPLPKGYSNKHVRPILPLGIAIFEDRHFLPKRKYSIWYETTGMHVLYFLSQFYTTAEPDFNLNQNLVCEVQVM